MHSERMPEKIAPEFAHDYQKSLQTIENLCCSPASMAAICGLPRNGNCGTLSEGGTPFNEVKYFENVDSAIEVLEALFSRRHEH